MAPEIINKFSIQSSVKRKRKKSSHLKWMNPPVLAQDFYSLPETLKIKCRDLTHTHTQIRFNKEDFGHRIFFLSKSILFCRTDFYDFTEIVGVRGIYQKLKSGRKKRSLWHGNALKTSDPIFHNLVLFIRHFHASSLIYHAQKQTDIEEFKSSVFDAILPAF